MGILQWGRISACAIVNNCAQTHCEASIGGDQPYIPQAKGVTVRSLMQGETIPMQQYHSEPARLHPPQLQALANAAVLLVTQTSMQCIYSTASYTSV